MAIHATKQGCTFHDDLTAPLDELAARVRLRAKPSSGQLFSRKVAWSAKDSPKHAARRAALECLVHIERPIHVLTLPGLYWQGEKWLANARERVFRKTSFRSAENDPAIFRAAMAYLPRDGQPISFRDERTVRAGRIDWFECIDVEKMILRDDAEYDAAWLDFTGTITDLKIVALKSLWPRINHSLVVTFLGARFTDSIGALKTVEGDWQKMLCRATHTPMGHSTLLTYTDKVPMVQVSLYKGLPEYEPWMA
jgi:hypothetical protein